VNSRRAAVVAASNEAATLPDVLLELSKLAIDEIIVVLNGCSDNSLAAVRRACPEAVVIHYPNPLGYDVGRAIGARFTDADVVLFVDGDFVIPAEKLAPFLSAVEQGADVALNDISPFIGKFSQWDDVSRIKLFMNHVIGHPEWRANSMTAVPHALSRRAIRVIGVNALCVPPLALAECAAAGLIIRIAGRVNVTSNNRIRTYNTGSGNRVARMIIGDHVEALCSQMNKRGERLSYQDTVRNRLAASGGEVE
jgi:glycosyltransferase involved in cell wall biosynthesis